MLQFGESTIRLAEIARQSGHASEAVANFGRSPPGSKPASPTGTANGTCSVCSHEPESAWAPPLATSSLRSG
jgi:hypothetical protein